MVRRFMIAAASAAVVLTLSPMAFAQGQFGTAEQAKAMLVKAVAVAPTALSALMPVPPLAAVTVTDGESRSSRRSSTGRLPLGCLPFPGRRGDRGVSLNLSMSLRIQVADIATDP